jgi:hypothetical protein
VREGAAASSHFLPFFAIKRNFSVTVEPYVEYLRLDPVIPLGNRSGIVISQIFMSSEP